MALEFQTTQPSDIEDIAEALVVAFKAAPDAGFVKRELLHWKYFERGPEWESARSYVLRKDGVIKAHCGVWPMNLEFSGQHVGCICFVDWVSNRELPGVGVLLKKKLMSFADTAIVVGGSAETRAVVPRIGFRQAGDVTTFVRVVRAWKQQASRRHEQLPIAVARLARNSLWSLSRKEMVPASWRADPVESFDSWADAPQSYDFPTPTRTSAYLNYWLRLPVAQVAGFEILQEKQPCGYFLLTTVKGQTRIADIRLDSANAADWRIAYGLATRTAEANPDTCEILAIASTPFTHDALKANGYRQRGADPLFLYDPKKRLASTLPIFLNLIDGDGAYLYDPNNPFRS